MRAETVRLVADEGLSYNAAAKKLGVSFEAVRVWCMRAGVTSTHHRIDQDAWEASRLPDGLRSPEWASQARPRGSQGKPRLYVGWTGDELDGYRPSEADVRDPVALEAAMLQWRSRVADTSATDVVERHCRSTWDASTR